MFASIIKLKAGGILLLDLPDFETHKNVRLVQKSSLLKLDASLDKTPQFGLLCNSLRVCV